jgi:hypothetical protein
MELNINLFRRKERMLSPRVRNSFAMLALVLVILACGAPSVPVTGATESAPVDAPAAGAGDAAPTEAAASGDAPVVAPSIQHTDIPVGLPEKTSGVAGDFDSSKVLSSGSLVGGDRFTYGRFERPFNANTMDVYFSQIDIVNTEVFQDDVFIFARIPSKTSVPAVRRPPNMRLNWTPPATARQTGWSSLASLNPPNGP